MAQHEDINPGTTELSALGGSFAPKTVEAYASPQSQRALEILKGLMPDITPDSMILYPGSAADIQLANVFGEEVVHVDPDAESMDVLRQRGLIAVASTIEDYLATLERPIDVLFSYNAGIPDENTRTLIRDGGYVIANNWHGAANALGNDTSFEVIAAVNPGDDRLIEPDRAKNGLGSDLIAVLPSGRIIQDQVEISQLDPETCTIIDQPKNTEALWLFRKNSQADNMSNGTGEL